MFRNLRYRFALFMQGRYGTDQLSRFLSVVVIILLAAEWIANHFLAFPGMLLFVRIAGILNAVLLFAIYFRTFSRNIPRRYAENQKFLGLKEKMSTFFGNSRTNANHRIEYHIYKCPQCSQKIRIPRGKGRIMVRCPKCGTEFMKQS
jgi:DNA-directed RNA polymerase subunit RPC12/RpoP